MSASCPSIGLWRLPVLDNGDVSSRRESWIEHTKKVARQISDSVKDLVFDRLCDELRSHSFPFCWWSAASSLVSPVVEVALLVPGLEIPFKLLRFRAMVLLTLISWTTWTLLICLMSYVVVGGKYCNYFISRAAIIHSNCAKCGVASHRSSSVRLLFNSMSKLLERHLCRMSSKRLFPSRLGHLLNVPEGEAYSRFRFKGSAIVSIPFLSAGV